MCVEEKRRSGIVVQLETCARNNKDEKKCCNSDKGSDNEERKKVKARKVVRCQITKGRNESALLILLLR